MKLNSLYLLILPLFFISSCSNKDDDAQDDLVSQKTNILLIIADDMGLDATPGYTIGSQKPNMPVLESLSSSGIRFNNLWSNPTCTPTRGSIITGKYGFRTGVTEVGDEMPLTETALQRSINGYNTAVFGKWHLTNNNTTHPIDFGVGEYAGFLSGTVADYSNWNFTQNGQTTNSTTYTTTQFTDLAIDWLDEQPENEPWFLWLAYNAPHTPFHLPPANLHTQGNLPTDQASIDANPLPYYLAMLEAMDTEMGRLLDAMTIEERENTVIIFIGDNGSPGQVVQEYNSNRAKGSLFQGGINVPMIISGKNVTRVNTVENALLNTTDLFATIIELTGDNLSAIHDSKSFKELLASNSQTSPRNYVYAERGAVATPDYTIRNATHKYILYDDGTEFLFNLSNNPLENPNLLNANQLPLSQEDSDTRDELIAQLSLIRN